MTTETHHEPNHHAHHPFAGATGVLAGLSMTLGREGDARIATERSALTARDRLVDLGCGPGAAARFAAKRGAQVTGVDPAPVMLDLARRLTLRSAGVTFVEGAAESIPLPDGCATVVWALATVHHWPELEQALVEVSRILEAGGRFAALERHTTPGATGLASHGWTDEQAAAFADLCQHAGFEDVSVATHPGRRRLVSVLARRP